jgi:CheY-like chemotaxis protein
MATILLVDDRRDAVLTIGNQLKSRGFVVRMLNDPTQLMEVLAGGGIDVILMDMNMPEMDGCEATELVKADEGLRHIPIIIFTSHPLPGDEERARLSGCDGFVAKPVDLEALQSLLELYFPAVDSPETGGLVLE